MDIVMDIVILLELLC